MKLRRCAAVLVAAVMFVPGCVSGGSGDGGGGADALPTYHITEERNGQTIEVQSGQVVALVLPTLAGSPSHWSATVSDPSVLVPGGRRALSPRAGGIVIGGTPGYERIEFLAAQSGSTRLGAERQLSPREGGGIARFEATVIVSPAALGGR